jgi:hypothetical protein
MISVTVIVEAETVASLMTAILSPGLTANISLKLLGIIGDVATAATGAVPNAKWQCPKEHEIRTIVVNGPNAVDATLELVTVNV